MLAIVILAACVAIPKDAPAIPTPKTERDVSVLASALAKAYLVDNVDEIHDRLTELEECFLNGFLSEDRFTSEELDILVFYMVGGLHTASMVARIQDVENGILEKLYEPDTASVEERLIQELEWTIENCYDD